MYISISFVILVFSIFDLILKEFNFLCSIFVHLMIDPSLFISVDIYYKCMLVFKKSRTTSLESIFWIIIYILWIAQQYTCGYFCFNNVDKAWENKSLNSEAKVFKVLFNKQVFHIYHKICKGKNLIRLKN